MLRLLFNLLIVISVLFTNIAFAQEETTTTTTTTTTPSGTVIRKEIVTTTPAPKETVAPPTGFANCFTVKAGWYQDVWVADREVCTYTNSPSGLIWVSGYWSCNKYDVGQGICTNWEWKVGHWEKTVVVY